MATNTLNSPGIQIFERDLSLFAPQNRGTNIFVTGFAKQGPVDEIINITSQQDLQQIYGVPTTASERYFYNTIDELLKSPATVYASRLPYGSGLGDGFGSKYSALAYPVQAVTLNGTLSSDVTSNLNLSAAVYVLGAPAHFELTQAQYNAALEGSLFNWSSTGAAYYQLTAAADSLTTSALGQAGLIILNKGQTTINNQFEGYYVGLCDNSNLNPVSPFDCVLGVNSLSLSGNTLSATNAQYTQVPAGVMQFSLSAVAGVNLNTSISQVLENLTDYNIDGRQDDDLLNLGVFKLRKSVYATEAFKLDYVLEDAIVGSIDTYRTRINPKDATNVSFFLEIEDNKSRNVELLVNPYISNKNVGTSQNSSGVPQKKIRMMTKSLFNLSNGGSYVSTTDAQFTNTASGNVPYTALISKLNYADALYPLGAFSTVTTNDKVLGSIPSKLNRSLEQIKNDEIYDIDLIVEGGLGTVYAMASSFGLQNYDDTYTNAGILSAISDISAGSNYTTSGLGGDIITNYTLIFNTFENVCNLATGRGDCMFIADPIRHFFVTGQNTKTLSDRTKNFTSNIYWPVRHQFENTNTSYAAMYANWIKGYDQFTGSQVWNPASGYVGAIYARSDAATFPWNAPAGFNYGIITTATDLAFAPNQKQRDEFYKANLNPIAFFPSFGNVVFGQKTLSKKPSAFDRVNVRRLFVTLERSAKKLAKFFVFQPNNEFTRTRLVNALTPIMERAKNNDGIYDYALVCNEKNNTPDVIDNNELKCSIYIRPVRTAEYIILEFIATRTDASFSELIG